MNNIQELQKDQIVRVWVDHLRTSGYEDGIITSIDYGHDEIEVQLAPPLGYRMVGVADIEVPR